MKQLRPALLAAAAVAIIALGASALLLSKDGVPLSRAVLAASAPSVLFGFIGLASRYPCRAIPLRDAALTRVLSAHAGAAAVASGLWLFAWRAWLPMVDGPVVSSPMIFGLGAVLYALTVTVQYLLVELDASRRAEETVLRYQVLAREAELKALKAQVDPHFLFNSLNAVAALCSTRPADARQMTQLIADFFRQTLALGALDRIPLGQEIDLLSRYLSIEKVRFGERLTVDIDIDDAAGSWLVPPLILQPLVENAVRHGIASMIDGGTILIRAGATDGCLRIRIENPADPDRRATAGERIGQENARGRLAAISGGRARLRTAEADGIYRVEIEVPQ